MFVVCHNFLCTCSDPKAQNKTDYWMHMKEDIRRNLGVLIRFHKVDRIMMFTWSPKMAHHGHVGESPCGGACLVCVGTKMNFFEIKLDHTLIWIQSPFVISIFCFCKKEASHSVSASWSECYPPLLLVKGLEVWQLLSL